MIKIEKRNDISTSIYFLTPILAIFLTLFGGGIIFYVLGFNPIEALKFFFITPISDLYGFSELLIKATPLCLIAIGLSFCFKSNNWNIGAEGQLIFGGIVGGGVALLFYGHDGFYVLPIIILSGANAGIFITLITVFLSWLILYKTYLGFQIKVSGLSLKTAKYAGYKGKTMIIIVFMISGACAGLAGVGEITGPIGQLHRNISPDYGFTAIIVAFLGRLNPVGIIFASLVVALTYLGAETAQIFLQVPKYTGQVFQGMILFFLLGSDYLLFFKIKFLGLKKNEL